MNTLIIGGGVIGLSSAYALQAAGESVTVLDANNGVGLDTSYANGGLLTASMSAPWNAPGALRHLGQSLVNPNAAMTLRLKALPSLWLWGLRFLRHSTPAHYRAATLANYRLAMDSLRQTQALRQRLGLNYQASQSGAIKLFRDDAAMAAGVAAMGPLQALGLALESLDSDALIAREPALAPIANKIAVALYFPADEVGDAYLFCQALARALKTGGTKLFTACEVQSIEVHRGRVRGVLTRQGFIPAERVVVAAGHQSARLLRRCGVSLPIKPVKGYSLTFELPTDCTQPTIPVIDDALHAAATPLGSRLRLAGTAEFAGFDRHLNAARIDKLRALLQALYPDIAARIEPDHAEAWAGLRAVSADGKPFIGPSRIKGLYINAGHGHLGWTLAMGSAQLLARLMMGQSPVAAGDFCVGR